MPLCKTVRVNILIKAPTVSDNPKPPQHFQPVPLVKAFEPCLPGIVKGLFIFPRIQGAIDEWKLPGPATGVVLIHNIT
jgi:hypothetical protein